MNSNDEQFEGGGLKPPRFSLRRFFLMVAIVAACFGAFVNFPPVLVGTVLFAIGLIALHVIGNAMGMKLRSGASAPDSLPRVRQKVDATLTQTHAAPPTKLSQRAALGRPMLVATGIGIVSSGSAAYFGMNRPD